MATIHQFPPRRASLYRPLVDHATPADIRRKIADERPDLFDALAKAGCKPSWRDEVAEDWQDFQRAVRRSPYSHALVAVFAIIAWTALLIAPLVLS